MKKSKKFVLAGLALLAITGLLVLAGCKNDTVPPEEEKQEQGYGGGSETDKNNTAAKLVSITVNPPTRTVYSEGEKVASEIGVTATYDDGTTRTVTGTITTDTSTLTESAGIGKPVTVSYMEGGITREDTFTVDVASYKFTETVEDYEYPEGESGTMTGGTYKKFGDWPQTIKEEGVEIGAGTLVRGGLTYHVGSDGNYYVEAEEKANGTQYKYSNGDQAGQGGTSTKWFKVEPIVWRVLNKDYASTGNALLLAESILTGGIPYYVDTNTRTITGAGTMEGEPDTVYPNNWQYSTIRAWLNGLEVVKSDDAQENDTTYTGKGFLQTAFTADAQSLIIAETTVDNSAASTNPASNPNLWSSGTNPYASKTPTTDKVFLLSEKEATNSEYGFAEYNVYVGDNGTTTSTRIRVTTDYAKATGAYQGNPSAGYGGRWWLRSPYSRNENIARYINIDGYAYNYDLYNVDFTYGGVVPALSISLQ